MLEFNKKVLVLSFDKGTSDTSLYNFEKLFIFNMTQLFTFYTPYELLDYAVPSHRMMLPQGAYEYDTTGLTQLCQRMRTSHVLYGAFIPAFNDNLDLQGINIHLRLFDVSRDTHALDMTYLYKSLEPGALFLPTPDGLHQLCYWVLSMLLGSLEPSNMKEMLQKTSKNQLYSSIHSFQKLADAHYLNSQNSLSQKMALLQELSQEQNPMFSTYIELGLLQKRMQNYSQAIIAFQWALKLMKDVVPFQRAHLMTEIGVCYALSSDHYKATQWWKSAIEADAMMLSPYLNLAHALEEQGKLSEAEGFFKQVQDIAPTDSRVYFNLARLFSKQERWDEAIEQYLLQLEWETDNPWTYSNLANCYLQKGAISDAKACLLKTVQLDPDGEAGRCAQFILSGLQAVEV